MGEVRKADKISVANPKEKKPLGRANRRWEDMQIRLQETVRVTVDW